METNHHIEEYGLVMWLGIDDLWYGRGLGSALESGEQREIGGVRDRIWQDVTGIVAKSLDGYTVRTWRCEQIVERHDVDGRFTCRVASEEKVAPLGSPQDPALWVYVSNDPPDNLRKLPWEGIRVDLRAGSEDLSGVWVSLRFGGEFADVGIEAWEISVLPGGEVRQPSHAGTIGLAMRYGTGKSSPPHTAVEAAYAHVAGVGPMRCERHEDSSDERSIWACEPW